MKGSFVSFWKKSKAAAKLAILSHLEYRFNFFIDAYAQPMITTLVEMALWYGIWVQGGFQSLNGFGLNSYLAYALWATFVARITVNWEYEMRMMEDIETGKLNAILLRPFSFYSFYLSQFFGYKFSVILGTLGVPLIATYFLDLPIHYERLPIVFVLILIYVLFAHTLSFFFSCFGFFMTRAHSLTIAKNVALWVLAGEVFPLDLVPEPYGKWMMWSPFASGVYVPVGFLTGRFGYEEFFEALLSLVVSLSVVGVAAVAMWRAGITRYVGTGA